METNSKTAITSDAGKKQIHVTRQFNAPVQEVWNAWTKRELLDQWWAPKPWKAETKSMEFREGGTWLYAMVGPDGTKMWSRADFETILPGQRFTAIDAFCDENGVVNDELPRMHWHCVFSPIEGATLVEINLTLATAEDVQKIIDTGFEEGFTAAHGNLDELLAKK